MKQPPLLALLLLAGCAAEPALEQTTQPSTAGMPKSLLDAPVGNQGVADLRTSQLVRLPTSYFLDGTVNTTGAHRFVVRTLCDAPEPERRDTGVVVLRSQRVFGQWQYAGARYNDDEDRNAACPTCSRVDMGSVPAGDYQYTVYAFSNRRTKASCQVEYRIERPNLVTRGKLTPPGWDSDVPVDLGGALVDLGPFDRTLEWIEVNTPDDGTEPERRNDTRMLLFDVGAPTIEDTATANLYYQPVLARDQPDGDRDARIAAPGGTSPCTGPTCQAPRHFALVGLERVPDQALPANARAEWVEKTVSLVRGPEEVERRLTAPLQVEPGLAGECGNPIELGIGRYSAALRARSRAAYGQDAGERGDTSWIIHNDAVFDTPDPGDVEEPPADLQAYFYRGTGNFRAFTMRVEARTDFDWTWNPITAPREAPNGAFGCADTADEAACFQTFLEDFELFMPSEVRICIDNADPRIEFAETWGARRNQVSAELKVATFNSHHGPQNPFEDGLENEAESRNLANLLATRGRFRLDARAVVETEDDAPFEWSADVVTMQEHSWLSSFEQFHAQARVQSDLEWRYVWGLGKQKTGYASYNSVFAHRLLSPGTLLPPAPFIPDGSECEMTNDVPDPNMPGSDGTSQCYNFNPLDTEWWDFKTYVVPSQVAIRRWSDGSDTPILVVSVMLQPNADYGKFHARALELASVIEMLEAYVANHPDVVGAAGGVDGVRIVLAGDFNFYPHAIGENRWFVRELRRAFGYAVDTAAAHRDSYANFYDMHSYQNASYAPWDVHPEGDNGYPTTYTTADEWHHLDDETTWWWDSAQDWPHHFPYWASTYRNTTSDLDAGGSHDRHDAVLLVGRGWAADDPVRGYVVMNTTAEFDEYSDPEESRGSPFALRGSDGRVVAVDLSPWGDGDGDNIRTGPDEPRHYKPEFALDHPPLGPELEAGCTANGCPAAESDHIPVGVRLRVTR